MTVVFGWMLGFAKKYEFSGSFTSVIVMVVHHQTHKPQKALQISTSRCTSVGVEVHTTRGSMNDSYSSGTSTIPLTIASTALTEVGKQQSVSPQLRQ